MVKEIPSPLDLTFAQRKTEFLPNLLFPSQRNIEGNISGHHSTSLPEGRFFFVWTWLSLGYSSLVGGVIAQGAEKH